LDGVDYNSNNALHEASRGRRSNPLKRIFNHHSAATSSTNCRQHPASPFAQEPHVRAAFSSSKQFPDFTDMSLSMHQASVPALVQILTSVSAILDKAAAHCEARKIDPTVIVNYRLAPNMFPLSRQVQIMTDQAKGGTARLAGAEVPSYPDTEVSFADLQARIAKVIGFVKSFPADAIDGSEDKEIVLKVGGSEMKFTGRQYLFNFVLPNFYFHATTTYAILRHCGVELGKRDFLGAI
jgi:hypothetical protein